MNYYHDFDFKTAEKLIKLALKEDVGKGDITSNLLIPLNSQSKAEILSKKEGVIAGLGIFKLVFKIIDKNIKIKFVVKEGDKILKKQIIGTLSGKTRSLLKGERLSLNIIQRMSGIATLTMLLEKKIGNNNIKLLDTRKTTPNFRIFEKLAVKIGGGMNHRTGLFDMILIKDNHISANGGISNTLKILRDKKENINSKDIKKRVEIEIKNPEEFMIVRSKGKGLVDRVMLDNFKFNDIKNMVSLNKEEFEIEVSGGINENNIMRYRSLQGKVFISVGALTHSAKSLDISLNFIT